MGVNERFKEKKQMQAKYEQVSVHNVIIIFKKTLNRY